MVVAGLTVCAPPVDVKVYLLPSDPVIVTCVAFSATTVRLEDAPGAIEEGEAMMVIAGTGFGLPMVPKRPQPVVKRQREKAKMRGTKIGRASCCMDANGKMSASVPTGCTLIP